MAAASAGPTLWADSNRMTTKFRITLGKHLGFPRHEVCSLKQIGLRDFQDILSIPLLGIPYLWDCIKTKGGPQVGCFMVFCYWYHCCHRELGPNAILDYYAEGDNDAEYISTKDIKKWWNKGLPRLHKQHYWAHVHPKGK